MASRINPGGHGWTKDVAPPPPGSRPKGLPPKPKEKILIMEASQQGGDQSQETQPGEAQNAQETPTQDSNLTTPQPDQQVPSEQERAVQEASGQQGESATAPVDQQTEADQRERELEAQRREHNERTGGGEVQEGEVQAQRDEHNARTGGDAQGGPVDDSQDQA